MKKKILKLIPFLLGIIILLIIRHYLILEMPVFAYIDYISDDELMVEQAYNIKNGNWLGRYGYNTLLKGPVFPLYLALLSILKIPYIFATTAVFAISCCLFVYSIKDIVKNKVILLIIFALTLFNPIMFSIDFQRVYRNSLVPSFALMIISFLNLALLNRNEDKMWKYIVGIVSASLILPFFYYLREDSIWIIPIFVFYSIIIAINIISKSIKKHEIKLKEVIKLIVLVLPILTMFLFRVIVGNINYSYYGENAINMTEIESLNDAIHAINIVKSEEGQKESTNSREKIRKLYTVSPTLASMEERFEWIQDVISGREGGDVGDAMFLWAFLETISGSGYDTFEKQDKVFKDIANEINLAIEKGELETQELTPIFADAALYKYDNESMIKNIYKAFVKINDYTQFGLIDTYGSLYSSEYFEQRIRYFLEITNDKLLLNNEPRSWNMYGELIKDSQPEYIERMQPKVQALSSIRDVYNMVSKVIVILGYASYVILTINLIIKIVKKNVGDTFNIWVILSGIIGSVFTLCFGVAYTSETKGNVTIPFYLMSAYLLNMVFLILSIISVVNIIVKKFKKPKEILK